MDWKRHSRATPAWPAGSEAPRLELAERRLDQLERALIGQQRKLAELPAAGEAAALRGHVAALERELELAHQRNAELAAQIRLVLEERFFRPVVTAPGTGDEPQRPEPTSAAFTAEEMTDVQYVDPAAEVEAIQKEETEWRKQLEARIRARTAAPSGDAEATS